MSLFTKKQYQMVRYREIVRVQVGWRFEMGNRLGRATGWTGLVCVVALATACGSAGDGMSDMELAGTDGDGEITGDNGAAGETDTDQDGTAGDGEPIVDPGINDD